MSFSPSTGIGQGLPSLDQFINWYPVPLAGGKTDKIPCDAFGNNIDAHDRANWRSMSTALVSAQRLGFVLGPDGPYICIDIDNAYSMATGRWSDLAVEVLATFPDAYTEVSQSGTGLHIIFRGHLPAGHRVKRKGLALEVYSRWRFIALTGYMARGWADTDYSDRILAFMARCELPLESPPLRLDEGRDPRWIGPEDDDKLIAMALAQRPTTAQAFGSKPTFKELWEFDHTALARKVPAQDGPSFDHSAVDASFMANLSYFTGRDMPRMVRLFERWKGYREQHYTGKGAYRLERVANVGAGNPNVMQRGPGERALEAITLPAPSTDGMIGYYDDDRLPESRPELIKDLCPADPGSLLLILGQSGMGKSLLVSLMAVCLAGASDMLGYAVRENVGVIIVAAEGSGTMDERNYAAKFNAGIFRKLPIRIIPRCPDLKDEKARAYLIEQINIISADMIAKGMCHRVGMVIIDTVSAAFAMQDENDSSEVRRICSMMIEMGEKTQTVTGAVHHYGKNAGAGARGSSAWRDAADHAIAVTGQRDEATGDVTERKVSIAKSRIGAEGQSIDVEIKTVPLGLNRYGEQRSVGVMYRPNVFQEQRKGKQRDIFTEAFEMLHSQHDRPKIIHGDHTCVDVEGLRHEFMRRCHGDDAANRKAWSRAREHWIDKTGRYGCIDGKIWRNTGGSKIPVTGFGNVTEGHNSVVT